MISLEELEEWKKKRDAVILAHYYVRPEVQALADYIGDSYFLSKKATELDNKTIVLCGVTFMGESAKLLNPDAGFCCRLSDGTYGDKRNCRSGEKPV